MKINASLLPMKAHWFFFMAASGPILPFLTVYGKQLGISEIVMGSVTSLLPLIFLVAKPIFGFLIDYFHRQRKLLFMLLIFMMSTSYILLYFVPESSESYSDPTPLGSLLNMSYDHNLNYSYAIVSNVTELQSESIYRSPAFYIFLVLMSLSMVLYNVGNSVSDAICFDVLGPGEERQYGNQRVWGAIGFGISALLAGLGMDMWSNGTTKNYVPAFILVIVATVIDLIFCTRLNLPKMGQSKHILKDVRWVLQKSRVIVFLCFATMAGILESFIIYFMFWFLEDLSLSVSQMSSIKILEGLIVAAETLGGEVIFFPLSGRILKTLGHGHTFTLCFFSYALRLGLISLIPSPWWLLPIEFFMQGASFALSYTAIVAYAGAIAPPGTSATMQGVVAGVDDGIGFAIGSLMGGLLYRAIGGRMAFRLLSGIAAVTGIVHAILYRCLIRHEDEPGPRFEYKTPTEAVQVTDTTELPK